MWYSIYSNSVDCTELMGVGFGSTVAGLDRLNSVANLALTAHIVG